MINMHQISRRQFIATSLTAAGGFALGIGTGGPAEAATLSVRPWSDDLPHAGEINAWVVINPDDSVIIRYGRAEMGQGSFTALPQILTEELECDWAFVKPEYASANRNLRENKVYGSLSTGGSRAVRETGDMVQRAGLRVRGRHEQGHAHADQPHVPVRRARRRGGRHQARQGAGTQAAGSIQVHRPA